MGMDEPGRTIEYGLDNGQRVASVDRPFATFSSKKFGCSRDLPSVFYARYDVVIDRR